MRSTNLTFDKADITGGFFREKQAEAGDIFGKQNVLVPAERDGNAFTMRMIPYYCFANRGETDMRIWFDYK